MPKISESILNEIPEGYVPEPFEPVKIKNIRDLRMDHTMDPEDWVDEMVKTVTEMYLPAEMVHEQDEKLRMLQYRIDREENPEQRQGLIELQDELVTRYAKERVDAEQQIEERLTEETKTRYKDNLMILNPDYEPDPELDEKLEKELSEEELMKGYVPVPFQQPILRSIDDQRELLEEIPEDGQDPEPVDEGEWAVEMYDIVKEEVMPASHLHEQDEEIRKLQHQINRINRNEDVANMDQPYELVDPDPTMLSPEDYQGALRDQLYKDELNRRFAKRRELEEIRDNYIELVEDNRANWEEEVDRRIEEEMDRRVTFLEQHEQELKEQREQEELQRLEKEERERQEKLERQRAIEEERQRREEEDRAVEEIKRKAAEEQAERQRRREEYIRNRNAELDAQANLIFAERVRKAEEDRRREAEEEQYRAEREERLRKNMKWNAMGGEQMDEEGDLVQRPAQPEQDATGVGLGEFLNDDDQIVVQREGDIDLGAQPGGADDFFEREGQEFAQDIVIEQGSSDGLFEVAPEPEDDLNIDDVPNLGDLLVDDGYQGMDLEDERQKIEEARQKIEEGYRELDEFDKRMGMGAYEPKVSDSDLDRQKAAGDQLDANKVIDDHLVENRSYVNTVIAKPKPAVDEIITLPKTKVASAYRPTEEDLKKEYLKEACKWTFKYAGDDQLLGDLFDARKNSDGKINKDINDILEKTKNEKLNILNSLGDRERLLNKIKKTLEDIPEDKRTEAQKKAVNRINSELESIPNKKEADKFADDVFDKGWLATKSVFRDMYLAGESLPKDHPYNKLLSDMREGKSQSHPEFPARKVKMGQGYESGVIAGMQTVDDLSKAKDLLEKEGLDSPTRKRAAERMGHFIKERRSYAQYEREQMPEVRRVLALGAEGREKLKNLADKLAHDQEACKLPDYYTVVGKLRSLSKDPAEKKFLNEVLTQVHDLDELKEKLPGYIRGLTDEHPAYQDAMEVLNMVAPDKVAEVTAACEADRKVRVEADIRRAEQKLRNDMDAFTKETDEFKVMRDNFAAVNRSYLGHTNSQEYDRMTAALNKVANSATPAELKENKKELADRTKEYLEHTGLGKASAFHKNAETRRKIAFLALHRASSAERPYYDSLAASANQLRKGDDRIDPVALANLKGVGKPLDRVKEINANDLANKVGAAPQERESHKRKPLVTTNQPAADMTGPTYGQPNNHK